MVEGHAELSQERHVAPAISPKLADTHLAIAADARALNDPLIDQRTHAVDIQAEIEPGLREGEHDVVGLPFGRQPASPSLSSYINPPISRNFTRGSGARCPRPPAFCFQRHPGAIPQDWRGARND